MRKPTITICKLFCRTITTQPTKKASFFHGQSCSDSSPSSSTLWFIKAVCTICIHYSPSLSVFHSDFFRLNLNPFIAYSVIFHITTRLKQPILAFDFFCYSRLNLNLIHSENTFCLLLRSLCETGFHDSAKLVYQFMKDDDFLPNLDFLVSCFCNVGNFSIAGEVLIAEAESREEPVSSLVYNEFLSLLIRRNRVYEAVAFFKDHVLRLCPDDDHSSFNIVMGGLCRIGEVDKAFEIFDVMKSTYSCPDIVTYNTLIYGLCRVGNVDRAVELLRDVVRQCEFAPNVVTYTSIISGYCKLGKMEDAAALFDEMMACGVRPNVFTFNVIIDGFGKKGDLPLALKVYGKMISGGLHPDVVTFTSLIDGHCRLGEVNKCLKIWDQMNDRKVSPNVFTFSVLISALCRENRLKEARDILKQLIRREDIVPPPFVYNPVIDGFCKSGNVDEANVIVAEMEAKGCTHDKMTFTILILGHCMKGRMVEAIGIYNKMLLLGCAPDFITTSSLISCLRKAGMAREAYEIEKSASHAVHTGLSSPEKVTQFSNNDLRRSCYSYHHYQRTATCLQIENLFYNMVARRKTPQNSADDLICRFAIHHISVSFCCRKHGAGRADVHSVATSSRIDAIRSVYGLLVAQNLLKIDASDCNSYRLVVECGVLKRAIEIVYVATLPKASKPFIYMSIKMPPEHIDMNVHPTKREVSLLSQEVIIEKIQSAVEQKLRNSDESHTFQEQGCNNHGTSVADSVSASETSQLNSPLGRTCHAKDDENAVVNLQIV